jgi:hypothetical protein
MRVDPARLVLIPHHFHSSLLIVHKASFYLWVATLLIHVAAHAKGMVRGAAADALRRTRIEAGARTRQLAVAGSVLLGVSLALVLAQVAETYLRLYPRK